MRPPDFRGVFRDDLLARAVYAEGAGIARAVPSAVAVPCDVDDVTALVAWAHATLTPLIPRGSGSGMAGGAVGGAGVLVDLSRLDAIGVVDPRAWCIRVEPGAIHGAVNARAGRLRLRLPVDPSSGAFCTVGGMAATNAAGAHTLRFGAMRRWVNALECVFDDGSHATVRRGQAPPREVPAVRRFLEEAHARIMAAGRDGLLARAGLRKEASGYALAEYARSGDLVDLLVGSEGTLALIVGLELALAPVATATSSVLAAFPSLDGAAEAAGCVREAGASACELLDRTFLDVAALASPVSVPTNTEAVLLIEVEADDPTAARDAAAALGRAATGSGASLVQLGLDAAAEEALWSLRHAASPILSRLHPALKSMQFIEDSAVPPEWLPEYVRGVRDTLARRDMRGVIFGHAGDANVHVNPLVDVRQPDWRERVSGVLDEVTALVAALGGTLTGEHGDGRLRAPLLPRVWGTHVLELFTLVKRCFDPRGILNPGVKVALAGQAPITDVKYDPTLPPLPHVARVALDLVEHERAYSRFRLSLLTESA